MTALRARDPAQPRARPAARGLDPADGLRVLMSLAVRTEASRVIVLIPAHNEASSIKETISSLRRQTRPPDEIIVVSDNSSDVTDDRSMLHGAKVLATVGNSARKAGALNQALAQVLPRLSRDDLVLVMDADSQLAPDWIRCAADAYGPWYRWGWTRTPAATWVAAWRHIVTVFRAAGAANVTWLLTFNVGFRNSGPVAAYWPGGAYVDTVGIDGYYERPRDTFRSHFLPTVRAVRRLTGKPILVSETAVGPAAGQVRGIGDLFAAVRRYRLTGLIWFDQRQHHGLYHQDWRLADNPAAEAAFRRDARDFGRPPPGAGLATP